MMAALLMMFFLGGSSGSGSVLTQQMLDDVYRRVHDVLVDSAAAEQATANIEALSSELKQFEKVFGDTSKSLAKLYRDHDADPLVMRAELNSLDSSWEAAQSKALVHRFELRDALTREEWNRLFGDQ